MAWLDWLEGDGPAAPDQLAPLAARIRAGRGGLLARLRLVRGLLAAGDVAGALDAAREAAELNPGVAAAALALGEALAAAGHYPAAIAECERALRRDPDLAAADWRIGLIWLEAGEPDRALVHLRRAQANGAAAPEDLAELETRAEQMRMAPRSPAPYVRALFDQFSADYDQRMLGALGYCAPQRLAELHQLLTGGMEAPCPVLDLGCGTGLGGAAFRTAASHLTGIDLSPRMIEAAAARGLYDRLATADIETALDGFAPGAFGLVLAADVFVYLGDLSAVFHAVARVLRPGGLFLFTVEAAETGTPFVLGAKRRWHHSADYLRGLAATHGFELAGLVSASSRSERGRPLPGYVCGLRKPHGPL